MTQRKMIMGNNMHLTAEEQNLTLEERGEILTEELKNFGMLRNYRYANIAELPAVAEIALTYNCGVIIFEKIPEDVDTLYLLMNEDHFEIYIEDPSDLAVVYEGFESLCFRNAKSGVDYDLNDMFKDPLKMMPILRTGTMHCYNSITDPIRFAPITGSWIDVILLKDGFLRFDLRNLMCLKMTFRLSDLLEHAVNLVLDADEDRCGDITFMDIQSGMVVYAPVLAAALQRQAFLDVADLKTGTYYAYVRYGLVPKMSEQGNVFVDINRYNNRSNTEFNLEFVNL